MTMLSSTSNLLKKTIKKQKQNKQTNKKRPHINRDGVDALVQILSLYGSLELHVVNGATVTYTQRKVQW